MTPPDADALAAALPCPFCGDHPPAAAAAALLRSLGWSVVAPVDPQAAIPDPEVGQVWRTTKPRVEPRTVVAVGPRPYRSGPCVSFRTPNDMLGVLMWDSWRAWARKSGARP